MSVDIKLVVYTEAEAFEDGEGEYDDPGGVKRIPEVLIQVLFLNTVGHGEVKIQFTDALDAVVLYERVGNGVRVITTGVVLVYPHPSCPLVAVVCVFGEVEVIAIFEVQTHGQGNFPTPLQACGYEIPVAVLREN